ncbi:MAG: hypothetical protein HQM00_01140 [Magnetococcales bacterium]|nr:hypothetical protein [Magnetococcales bacterium]
MIVLPAPWHPFRLQESRVQRFRGLLRELVFLAAIGWAVLAGDPAWALDARSGRAPAASLEQVRLVEHPPCGPDRVWIEEFFRVEGFDPADLLLVRTSALREVTRAALSGVDSQGRVVYAHCGPRASQERVETRFLTVQGESTPALTHPLIPAEQKADAKVTPLLGLHQVTRYMQFADQSNPEKKGTCCWHHVYVQYPWQGSGEISEITLPMRFDPVPKPESHHLYYFFYSAINDIKFYFGLQTNLKLRGKDHGVGAIFSRWVTQDPKDLQAVEGGFHEIGDYEGQFVSVRKPLALESAPMALRLTSRADPADASHVWLELAVIHQSDGAKRIEKIGALRFPGSAARLTKKVKIAVESYSLRSVSKASAWRVPFFDWSIEAPRINGKTLTQKPEVIFPERAPRVVRATPRPDGGVRLRRSGLIDLDATEPESGERPPG